MNKLNQVKDLYNENFKTFKKLKEAPEDRKFSQTHGLVELIL